MKNIHYIIIVLLVFMTGTSCNHDLVNIDNPNEATNESFWKTPEDAIAGVNACYSSLSKEGTFSRSIGATRKRAPKNIIITPKTLNRLKISGCITYHLHHF